LVEPEDQEVIWHALRSVLEDQSLARRLRDAGLRRAASFSWDRAAGELHSLLTAPGTVTPG
jgi:hypothetical protein